MGYRKIINLYKPQMAQTILSLDECIAMEKIHGTSAHVGTDHGKFFYYHGGIKESAFVELLEEKFESLENLGRKINEAVGGSIDPNLRLKLTIYGEAYGGKCQKMSHVYGPLNFVAFDVKLELEGEESYWLNVPDAEVVAMNIGLDFVYWEQGPATIEWLDSQRDMPSAQAERNGMGEQYGEGIVIRATTESIRDRWGDRVIAKHKSDKHKETRTPRKVDPEKQKMWAQAHEVAKEFVVPERLRHVLDALAASGNPATEAKSTGDVVRSMIADVRVEEGDAIEWSIEVQKAIGSRAAKLFRAYLKGEL